MAQRMSGDLFSREPGSDTPWAPKGLSAASQATGQWKHYLKQEMCLKVTGVNVGRLEPVKTRV